MADFDFTIAGVEPSITTAEEQSLASQAIAFTVDPTTSDMVHDGHRLQRVSGLDAIAQSLRTRLLFFQGEWFLDEEFGTPYFQTILGKSVPFDAVREVFRQIILDTRGVNTLISLVLAAGSAPREYVLSFRADTDFGELSLSESVGIGV